MHILKIKISDVDKANPYLLVKGASFISCKGRKDNLKDNMLSKVYFPKICFMCTCTDQSQQGFPLKCLSVYDRH